MELAAARCCICRAAVIAADDGGFLEVDGNGCVDCVCLRLERVVVVVVEVEGGGSC